MKQLSYIDEHATTVDASRAQTSFELDEVGPAGTRVRSATWATFRGLRGKVYRALVIGTGAHRVVVRLVLRRIAAAAGKTAPATRRR